MAHTFKAPVSVWIGEYSSHDADTLQVVDSAKGLSIFEADADWSDMNYTKVGFGEVTITIAGKDEIVQGKVEQLRAQLQADRASSQARQNALISKISELEALTYTEAA